MKPNGCHSYTHLTLHQGGGCIAALATANKLCRFLRRKRQLHTQTYEDAGSNMTAAHTNLTVFHAARPPLPTIPLRRPCLQRKIEMTSPCQQHSNTSTARWIDIVPRVYHVISLTANAPPAPRSTAQRNALISLAPVTPVTGDGRQAPDGLPQRCLGLRIAVAPVRLEPLHDEGLSRQASSFSDGHQRVYLLALPLLLPLALAGGGGSGGRRFGLFDLGGDDGGRGAAAAAAPAPLSELVLLLGGCVALVGLRSGG